MKIDKEHLYHGAALIQIAEHKLFTAINSLKVGGKITRAAYKVNDDIAVYFKYRCEAVGPFNEYQFTFKPENIAEIEAIARSNPKCFIALVCVGLREIACITYAQLAELLRKRNAALKKIGRNEVLKTVLVTAEKGKKLRVYVNEPGHKNSALGKILISRNCFPDDIFG